MSRKFRRGEVGVLTFLNIFVVVILVNYVFHRYGPSSSSNWTQNGSMASRGGSLSDFFRKPIATFEFPVEGWSGAPVPFSDRSAHEGDSYMYLQP